MKKLILALLLAVYPALAAGQSVQQGGQVTPGHAATWITDGVLGDGGAPGGPIFTGSTTTNDFACAGASGTIIDCGLSAVGTNAWTGLQNFNGGATAPTRSAGDNTTNVATTAFIIGLTGTSGHAIPFLDGTNLWSGVNTFTGSNSIILGANGGNVGSLLLKGSTSGQIQITTDATGANLITALANASQTNAACYNSSSGALTYNVGVDCVARGGFRANLNGSNWTYTTPATNNYVLVPLAAAAFNLGSYYTVYPGSYSTANPPTNTKFTPPAGVHEVCFGGSLLVNSGAKTTTADFVIKVVKNFVVNSSGTLLSGTDVVEAQGSPYANSSGTVHFTLSGCDAVSASDYYGLFIYIDGPTGTTGGDSIVVSGNTTHTSWSAAIIY